MFPIDTEIEASSCCGFGRVISTPDSGEIVCESCGADISDKTEDKGNDTSVNAGSPSRITIPRKEQACPARSLARSLAQIWSFYRYWKDK